VVEFIADGLWFAPNCKDCFLTNKYLHHGHKICGHTWQAQRLDKTEIYILFPSTCWHTSFYQDEFNKTFIQAQLLATPLMEEDTAHTTCSFVGQDFIAMTICTHVGKTGDHIL
jgi:hypothetical protein